MKIVQSSRNSRVCEISNDFSAGIIFLEMRSGGSEIVGDDKIIQFSLVKHQVASSESSHSLSRNNVE